MTSEIVFVCLNETGLRTATRLRPAFPGAQVHGLSGRAAGADVPFSDVSGHLRGLFAENRTIIALCAAGIVIRALAPLLTDKHGEPPVVCLAADGGAVVPLLGGHRGANRLARRLADLLGGTAAVTTAGDAVTGEGLDDAPPGWGVSNPQAAKALMAGAIDGASPPEVPHTERIVPPGVFALHPPVLALGVGCDRGCPPEDLETLVRATLAETGLSEKAVACVTSIDLKSDEAAVLALAERLGVPARFFPAATLEAQTPRLVSPSETVFAEVGCHGVAEGAALAAAGPDGALIVAKRKTARATCAVAKAVAPLDPATIGRPRGVLHVIGIGPGQAAWRSPEVTNAVASADALVGYGLYLDLLGDLTTGKDCFETDLGHEEGRARRALELAAEGRTVCLVCSGDAGIFALATLVFELLERADDPAWNRVAIDVRPGISALQAAAARAGAPIGHDFCAISLSDLLTPRPVIEKRVTAAAEGDFVIAFYNPVSKRRRDLLARARDLLLVHRPPTTPVILARNLGRPDETIRILALADLAVDDVDMLTLVMIGNSETRTIERGRRTWVYTPRGYAGKIAASDFNRED